MIKGCRDYQGQALCSAHFAVGLMRTKSNFASGLGVSHSVDLLKDDSNS